MTTTWLMIGRAGEGWWLGALRVATGEREAEGAPDPYLALQPHPATE